MRRLVFLSESYHIRIIPNHIIISNSTQPSLTEESLVETVREVVTTLSTKLQGKIDENVAQVQEIKPFPTYVPDQEKEFVDAMKPKHRTLTNAIDKIEKQLKELEDACGRLNVETTALHPQYMVVKDLVKELLTICCTHTGARILLSKAASNASGNLLASLEATLQFASANKLELNEGILQKLHVCRDKLKAAATSSKQKAAAK